MLTSSSFSRGDHRKAPKRLGTTNNTPPDTPDDAGMPILNEKSFDMPHESIIEMVDCTELELKTRFPVIGHTPSLARVPAIKPYTKLMKDY